MDCWPGALSTPTQELEGLPAHRPRFSGPISEKASQDTTYSPSSHLPRVVLHGCVRGCPGAEGCYENGDTAKEVEEPAIHGWRIRRRTVGEPDRSRDAGHFSRTYISRTYMDSPARLCRIHLPSAD